MLGGFNLAQLIGGVITTAALTFALLSASVARASHLGAANPMTGAEHYGCGDVCYSNYYYCLLHGGNPQTCAIAYNLCLSNCGVGALGAVRAD